jgi:hypothetical protein
MFYVKGAFLLKVRGCPLTFIVKTTAKEVTIWQDQIINSINVRKSWQGRKRKPKKDGADWKKVLCNQMKPPLNLKMKKMIHPYNERMIRRKINASKIYDIPRS